MLILTVSADGAVPLAHRVADGNTTDDQTHIATWDGLVALTGRPDFLYVADSKLCTREQMTHIDRRGGRFVTVLPRTRKEDGLLRDWTAHEAPEWIEAARRPAKRKGDLDDVWRVAPAPFPSSEGYRITWAHSSQKQRLDEAARSERIQRARRALAELGQRLAGPRARISSRVAAEEATAATLAATGAQRWITVTVTETTEETVRQEKRGRPGKDTRYIKKTKTRYGLDIHIDADQVRHDAASDGCFPLISNDPSLTHTELLTAYRYQPNLEKRHHQLKSVQDAAPITLKSPARIEALFACHFIALLCCCLIERELRAAMVREGVAELPLYHEDRSCNAPTAARVFACFADVQRHHLTRDGHHIQVFQPQLTPLQQQLLDLLGLPASAYLTTTPGSSSSRHQSGGRYQGREVRKGRSWAPDASHSGHTGRVRCPPQRREQAYISLGWSGDCAPEQLQPRDPRRRVTPKAVRRCRLLRPRPGRTRNAPRRRFYAKYLEVA